MNNPYGDIEKEEKSSLAFKLLFLIIIISLILFTLFLVRNHSVIEHWQAKRSLRLAIKNTQKGDFIEASKHLNSAWNKGMQNPDVVLNMATFLSDQKTPDSIFLWKHLLKMGHPLSNKDLRFYATSLSINNEFDQASKVIRDLIKEEDIPENWKIAGDIAFNNNQDFIAWDYYNKLDNLNKLHDPQRNNWMQIVLRNPSLPKYEDIVNELDGSIKNNTAKQDMAVNMLLRARLSKATNKRVIPELLKRKNLTIQQRTNLLSRSISTWPDNRTSLIKEELLIQKETHPNLLLPFLNWLQNNNEYEAIYKLLADKPINTLGPGIEHYCNALVRLDKSEQLSQILKGNKSGMKKSMLHLYRASLASKKSESVKNVDNHLELAIKAAKTSGDTTSCYIIADHALVLNRKYLSKMALSTLIEKEKTKSGQNHTTETKKLLYKKMKSLAYRLNDTGLVTDIVQLTRQQFGTTTNLDLEFSYLKLLQGEEIETYSAVIKKVKETSPETFSNSLYDALLAYRLGKPIPKININNTNKRHGQKTLEMSFNGINSNTESSSTNRSILPEEIELAEELTYSNFN